MKSSGTKLNIRLDHLPTDVLLRILTHLQCASPNALTDVALTNVRLSQIVSSIRRGGQYSLNFDPSSHAKLDNGVCVKELRNSEGSLFFTYTKNETPGFSVFMYMFDVAARSSHWSFRLNKFKGNRIDIGVARLKAFRFHSVERASSWSFDCFGRVTVMGKTRTYGRRMQEGDVVGVVYDYSSKTLSFLDNGISMGKINIEQPGTSCPEDHKLIPYVYLPYVQGESISMVLPSEVLDLDSVHRSEKIWRKPSGLRYDSMVIVTTWEERLWYAIDVDCETTTLRELWQILEKRHSMSMELFELISNGKRLENTYKKTLRDVGIYVDPRTGSCRYDILLSVPHIVS